MKGGIIGCGHWGPNVIRNFLKHGRATVAAICDQNEAALALMREAVSPQCLALTDPDQILADPGIDAAVTSVTVSPSTTTLIHGQSVQLTATVNGTGASPAVIWSFSPTLGTLSSTGLYTAPASVFQNFTITVTATSLSDPSKFGSATIFLVPTVSISVNPTSVTLSDGQSQQFVATVMGTANTDVMTLTTAISPSAGLTFDWDRAVGLFVDPVDSAHPASADKNARARALDAAFSIHFEAGIFQSSASNEKKLIWTLAVVLLPVLGLILWYFLGPRDGKA